MGFTVENTNDIHRLGSDQTVVFNRVVYNMGDAFKQNTGIFIAPFPGVYTFFFDIRVLSRSYACWINLVRDNEVMDMVYAKSDLGPYDEESNSNFPFFYLESNNNVWLKSKRYKDFSCSIDDLSSSYPAISVSRDFDDSVFTFLMLSYFTIGDNGKV